MRRRDGYALLTVLWVMAAAAAVSATGALAARESVNAGRNRVQGERAYWAAHECEARGRALVDSIILANAESRDAAVTWRRLDSLVVSPGAATSAECSIHLEAAGARLDINTADSATLRRFYSAAGSGSATTEIVDAILDWRDSDDIVRAVGAESSYYAAAALFTPRNGPFASVGELHRVRGFAQVASLAPELTVEPGHIAINSASAAVLRSLPGFTEETIAYVLELRSRGLTVSNLLDLSAEVSVESRNAMIENFPEISRNVVVDPDAWFLTARARAGFPATEATIELRLVRANQRTAVLRRRSW
jgi:general secretion pathway protein K